PASRSRLPRSRGSWAGSTKAPLTCRGSAGFSSRLGWPASSLIRVRVRPPSCGGGPRVSSATEKRRAGKPRPTNPHETRVTGHSSRVMTVQAPGVRRLLGEAQEREREALLVVEQTGREALAEMRKLVGVLRRPEEAPALAPQPSLKHLERLVEQVRESGLDVDL